MTTLRTMVRHTMERSPLAPAVTTYERWRRSKARARLHRYPWVTTPSGTELSVDPDDDRAVTLCVTGGCMDHDLRALWNDLATVLQPSVILDVGANYGDVSLDATYPDGSELHLFEPNERCLSHLRRSLDRWSGPSATLHSCALGDRDGDSLFAVHPTNSGLSSLAEASEGAAQRVPVRRLDSIIPHSIGRCLVKIDAEGFDTRVLIGLQDLVCEQLVVVMEFCHSSETSLLGVGENYRCFVRERGVVKPLSEVTPVALVRLRQNPRFLKDCVLLRK